MSYYDTCFEFGSMTEKYRNFTGKNWNYSGNNDTEYIKKNFPTVTLEGNQALLSQLPEIRDWCQEHFGDKWIYDWNDFYFIEHKDATFFALKWL